MKSVLWASSRAAAVGDPVDGGEDRLAQLAHRVERAVEVLALAQPVLLGHVLALAQVAADGEGPVAGAGEDDDADGGADRDRLDDLGQAGAHLGGDRVVGVGPVQGDDRDAIVGEVVDEHGRVGLRDVGRRWAEVECLPAVGACRGRGHVVLFSVGPVRCRAPPASAARAGRGRSSTRRRG